MLACIYNYIW